MKAHSLTVYSVAAAIAISYFSMHIVHTPTRSPASEENTDDLKNSLCISKRNEAKLEEQLKRQLKDKEEVLKEVESLKKEIKEAKAPSTAQLSAPAQAPSLDIVGLMAQITSLLQTQQHLTQKTRRHSSGT